jgi:hypothetical protein
MTMSDDLVNQNDLQQHGNETKEGAWFTGYDGRQITPWALKVEHVHPGCIAHQLALINRWLGCSKWPISVGRHSVRVYSLAVQLAMPMEVRKWCILHDADESFSMDAIRPIKRFVPELKKLASEAHKVIAEYHGLPEEMPDEVHMLDNIMLAWEWRDGLYGEVEPPFDELLERFEATHGPLPKLTETNWRDDQTDWLRVHHQMFPEMHA